MDYLKYRISCSVYGMRMFYPLEISVIHQITKATCAALNVQKKTLRSTQGLRISSAYSLIVISLSKLYLQI
jgi:hypothetical protein